LMFAIPVFLVLIGVEAVVAGRMGIRVNRPADMISSLSSGVTNTVRDGINFGIILISYSWMVNNLTLYKLEPVWVAVIIAFVVEDFTGYWLHRMNHRVNVFWNRHIIHHSSEEFNLSCALRQSISDTVKFGAIFMIPAALLGIPTHIFAIIGPIHLFMQFWYHTRLIAKMGWLEKVIVTPSHHRVHHAINPEYIDKNYSQIFIIWDKLFGSFQPELPEVKPVYGILRPANTWNPVIINFKHLWQLIKDAIRTEKAGDKIRVWFMPTGWRPEDVKENFPIQAIQNPAEQIKYETKNSPRLILWSWAQMLIGLGLMFHLFYVSSSISTTFTLVYALFLVSHVFSYTALLDGKNYAVYSEGVKFLFGLTLFGLNGLTWFGSDLFFSIIIGFYLIISFGATLYFIKTENL
ncbi:MAG: sterol desaturase family protein, partial [Candidatus Marinimicrobia bacterium]|nr:sterol desaturase family protein [Candidatus Neomarinimicrobiota bacterium]